MPAQDYERGGSRHVTVREFTLHRGGVYGVADTGVTGLPHVAAVELPIRDRAAAQRDVMLAGYR